MVGSKFFRTFFKRNANAEAQCIDKDIYRRDSIEVKEPALLSSRSVEKSFYHELFGSSDEGRPLSVPQKLVLGAVRGNLGKKEVRAKTVPRLPSVIPRLLRSIRDPDASAKDYVDIINKDAVMSAAVLQLANSVYFNPINARISSIERAVVKLGIEGLRSVLSAAVMQPIIQRKSPYFDQFGRKLWEHSLCCAVTCELLARKRGLQPFKAYIMGLTHDIGKITIFSELCKQLKIESGNASLGINAFAPLINSFSATLSHSVAKDWGLPEEVCAALEQQLNLRPGKQVGPYGHLLYQANFICEAYTSGQHENSEIAKHLIAEMSLPEDLFATLDTLSIEV